ncbi:MAG: YdiU family protein [Myxococcota bacterium]|nr:YdiU family protein [Myxococcota bacterium]
MGQRYTPRPVYQELGEGFADVVEPARFPEHTLRFRNQRWAERVGLGDLSERAWEDHMARFVPLEDNLEAPLAMRYHGHQFRHYNPDLGDGRGFLFAQLEDGRDGRNLDLATKGSGKTPYSRGGDGRLTLKGGVREVLATEMLEALGVYTSKTLSVFETGESLVRHDEPSPTRACVLVRLGHSHIRFGTFQRHAYERSEERLHILLEHVATHYMPNCLEKTREDTARSVFSRVMRETARLCSQWMAAGFVHGVLNTDNMNINGESFDYGPWRFLPELEPNFVAAYFDQQGIYRYGLQPAACRWNLARLADALSLVADRAAMEEDLDRFEEIFWREVISAYLARLGIAPRGFSEDEELVSILLEWMQESRVPYQQFFFDWYGGAESSARAARSPAGEHYDGEMFSNLRRLLRKTEPAPGVDLMHAYFEDRETPCDMLIDEVEEIWEPIAREDDWSAFEKKVADIRSMGEALGVKVT